MPPGASLAAGGLADVWVPAAGHSTEAAAEQSGQGEALPQRPAKKAEESERQETEEQEE